MKKVPDIKETLDNLFEAVKSNYYGKNLLKDVILNFELNDEKKKFFYSVIATKKSLSIKNELSENCDLSVKCKAIDWLNIAAGRLNPILAIVTGKFKIKGDLKLINAVFNSGKDLLNRGRNLSISLKILNLKKRGNGKSRKKLLQSAGLREEKKVILMP